MPFKVWAVGEEVLAADFNDYIQEQVVATFPNAAARDAAIIAPTTGQMVYIIDIAQVQLYDGAAWQPLQRGQMRVLYENIRTTNSPAIGATETVVAGPSFTFTPRAGVQYYCRFGYRIGVSASLFPVVRLRAGSAAGALLAMLTFVAGNAAGVYFEGLAPIAATPGNAVTAVLTLTGSSAGTSTIFCDASQPGLLQIIERVGFGPTP